MQSRFIEPSACASPQCHSACNRCLVQLSLLGDDGTVVERPFEACIFSGRGHKALYKLDKDAERLSEAEATDATVALVGRFKESKRRGGSGDDYIFNVCSPAYSISSRSTSFSHAQVVLCSSRCCEHGYTGTGGLANDAQWARCIVLWHCKAVVTLTA